MRTRPTGTQPQPSHNHFPNHPPIAFQPRTNHRKPQPIHNHAPTTRNGRDTIRDTVAKDYCAVGLLRHDNVVADYAFAGVGCAGCEGESGVVERQAVHMADVEAVGGEDRAEHMRIGIAARDLGNE